MQFLLPESVTRKSKHFPRHFEILAQYFCGIELHCDLDSVVPGQWAIVVRSLGSRGLSRVASEESGARCALDVLSNNEIEAVRAKAGRIILDFGWEILNPTLDIVDGFAATLASLNINSAQICMFHSNLAARRKFNTLWRQVASTAPPLSVEYPVGLALFLIHQQKNRNQEYIAKRQVDAVAKTMANARSRLFVSFNGEVRPHRLYIGAALQRLGILKKGYYSLLYPKKNTGESREAFQRRSIKWLDKFPHGHKLTDAAFDLVNQLPMKLDVFILPTGNLEDLAWESQDPFYYDDSRFSIVVDTSMFEENCLSVTEKVLKSIVNYSPFILIGNPGGIDLLASYGFRTFEPFLRQGEANTPAEILTSAIEEIHRISELDEDEIDRFSHGLVETCAYNAAHFWDGLPTVLKHQFIQSLSTLSPQVSAT